ncbi:MAG: hypothetical protein IT423_16235 [Pirellulaceae bacterium]|nr:hypothetical protein [Pirellulaceae bacterium]
MLLFFSADIFHPQTWLGANIPGKCRGILAFSFGLWSICVCLAKADEPAPELDRAILRSTQWLAAEVPAWMKQHQCAACHHQGDATRALILALDYQASVQPPLADFQPIATSLAWCSQPTRWSSNRGDPQASDHRLAEIQFAFTLLRSRTLPAPSAGFSNNSQWLDAIEQAALLLRASQAEDGSWTVSDSTGLGSPITHGPILLTGHSAAVLTTSRRAQDRAAAEKAWLWLCKTRPRNVFEASSLILAIDELRTAANVTNRLLPHNSLGATQKCIELVLSVDVGSDTDRNNPPTGYGPYANAPAENFDTALTIMALATAQRDKATSPADVQVITSRVKSAARYLITQQQADGSWEETTRMSDISSYAHQVSTTAWCLQSLLAVKASNTADK